MSFLFWKPASTRRDLLFSAPTPQPRRRLALRAVTPFRCGKMQAVQALRVFNKTIRAFSHFPSRVCFFSHLLQKKKLTQTCEFFLLEIGVDILSRARVRVIHRALLHCAAKCAARGSPITRCIPFASGKSFRSRTPRFNKTIRTVADFPSADRLLGCPRKIVTVEYVHVEHKTKSPHKRVSFLFWKPASTRRDLLFSAPTPQPRRRLALRAVTPFRCGKMQAVQALRVFNKTIRAFSHFPSRVCFFSHLLQKKKLTQTCEFFLLETGVDILSRAVSSQVPSARMSLTSVFGMRTGGTSSP